MGECRECETPLFGREVCEDEQACDDRMRMQKIDVAVMALDAINGDDPEAAHAIADVILLSLVPAKVCKAYEDLVKRCNWWASA